MKTVTSQIAFEPSSPEGAFRAGSIVSENSETDRCIRSVLNGFIVKADSLAIAKLVGITGVLYALISGILNLLLLIS